VKEAKIKIKIENLKKLTMKIKILNKRKKSVC
jgi:hypothetical protein